MRELAGINPLWSGARKQQVGESRPVDNYSITTTNLRGHLKIAMVSLIASGSVVAVGIAARPSLPDMSTRLEAQAPILKADKPDNWTSSNQTRVR